MLAFITAYSIGIAAAQLRSVLSCAIAGILVLVTVAAGVSLSDGAFGWLSVVLAVASYNAGIMTMLGVAMASEHA